VIHHDFIKATKYIVFGKSQYVLNRQNSIYPMARNEVLIRWLRFMQRGERYLEDMDEKLCTSDVRVTHVFIGQVLHE
jgi:hypothetical protein